MLEYLDKLVEERKWEEALAYAEQLLHQVEADPLNLFRVNVAILVSRFESGEYYGAQAIGQLCVKMAKELGAWEHLGKVALYLGASYERLGQYDQALSTWLDYLGDAEAGESTMESMVRYNVGIAYVKMDQYQNAIPTFHSAIDLALSREQARIAHGIRHALIEALIRTGDTSEVPALLAKSLHYVRHQDAASVPYDQSRLWHFVVRSEFAIATGRYKRAELVAKKGLMEVGDDHRLSVSLHMLMARICKAQGRINEAIDHALNARIEAIACRRYDLELQAAEYMYLLIS